MFTKGFDAMGTSIAGFKILNLSISKLGSNAPTTWDMLIHSCLEHLSLCDSLGCVKVKIRDRNTLRMGL